MDAPARHINNMAKLAIDNAIKIVAVTRMKILMRRCCQLLVSWGAESLLESEDQAPA
jgi:hypothetical protein